jgi:tripartite-type tricarboxylate transporter receptor subunit TctC
MIARTVAQKLTDQNKWNVIVDNRPGAGGNLGVDAAAKSAPDGYTLVIGQTSNLAINPTLYPKLPYDPLKDLVPVALVSSSPIVMAAPANSPFKTYADVVAAAKGKPDVLTLGYSGNGTVAHLSGELAQNAADIKLRHIPYKGAAPALQDALSGQADFVCDPGIAFPHIKAGKVKLLGVVSAVRSPFFPDVKTVGEQGLKGADLDIWFGMWAPQKTPSELVARMSRELAKALGQATLKARYADLGAEPVSMDTPRFRQLLDDEGKLLSSVIREQKIVVE